MEGGARGGHSNEIRMGPANSAAIWGDANRATIWEGVAALHILKRARHMSLGPSQVRSESGKGSIASGRIGASLGVGSKSLWFVSFDPVLNRRCSQIMELCK